MANEAQKSLLNLLIKKFIHWLENNWYTKSALFYGLIILSLVSSIPIISIKQLNISKADFIAVALLDFIYWIIWFITTYIPKTPRNKIGFYVAISCHSKEEEFVFKSDFIDILQKSLQAGTNQEYFHFYVFPNYIADGIKKIGDANKLISKYKGKFLLYGSVRTRLVNNKETTILDLGGVVTHRVIPANISKIFGKEFSELLPQRIFMGKDGEILQFEFTAQFIDIISKYIIGISFLVSGLSDNALHLYEEVAELSKKHKTNLPAIVAIRKRLPIRFFEIYSRLANQEYDKWLDTEGSHDISLMKTYILKMSQFCPNVGRIHLYRAIMYFLDKREISKAKIELQKCTDVDKTTILCSTAFLNGYAGDISSAQSKYKKASKLTIPSKTIDQIEQFICIILKLEPDKYQLHYCLACINMFIKDDQRRARRDFNEFIKKNKDNKYPNEIRLAKEYADQLK